VKSVTGDVGTSRTLCGPESDLAEGFLRQLSAAARNVLFYPRGHAVLKKSMSAVHASALAILGGRSQISIGLLGEEWIVHNTLLHKATTVALDLKERLKERGITSITLTANPTDRDVEALVGLLTEPPESVRKSGASAILRNLGAAAVTVGHLAAAGSAPETAIVEEEAGPPLDLTATELLQVSATAISELYSEAVEGSMDLARARSMLGDITDLVGSGQTNLRALVNIKSHDNYTYTHIVNVCILTLAQARRLALSAEMLDDIGLSALMHDVGKQRIPAEIIKKPGRLNTEEFEIMKTHTVHGAELLRATPGAPELPAMVAFEHHLRYDCRGYPAIGRRRRLNLCTYLTMIADAFDAMRTLRPYSKQMSQQEVAVRMAADSETHFEPVLLGMFLSMLDPFPCGSRVRLSTGEEAVVVSRTSREYMRPVVRLAGDSAVNDAEDGKEVDLARQEGPSAITIAGAPAGGDDQETSFSS
jgi:HD-GYP domain-containing protein (c-di-GMP phosphodiesterase class II)